MTLYYFLLVFNGLFYSQLKKVTSLEEEDKIVSLPIIIFSNIIYIKTSLGIPQQMILEIMNLKQDCIWTVPRYYQLKTSVTADYIQNITIRHKEEEIEAFELRDIMYFDHKINTTILFKYAHSYEKHDKNVGGFGFSLQIQDTNYSLLHQLQTKKLIKHLKFGFVWQFHLKTGILYLGGIPFRLLSFQQKSICKVNPQEKTWNCKLNRISFGNDSSLVYNNTLKTYFKTNKDIINVPFVFYQFLIQNIFDKKINSKECTSQLENDLFYLTCYKEILSDLPYINIYYGNIHFSLPLGKLFYIETNAEFAMQNKKKQNHKWVFGSSFLSLFTVVFDYENKHIEFYNEQGISNTSEFNYDDIDYDINEISDGNQYAIVFNIITIAILLLGLAILVLSYYLIPKRNQC